MLSTVKTPIGENSRLRTLCTSTNGRLCSELEFVQKTFYTKIGYLRFSIFGTQSYLKGLPIKNVYRNYKIGNVLTKLPNF